MASARKKQDEKHLKILRDLVSNPPNRQCFDCHQRGPTYVNMTIGSFVCTSCSGLLRGLTPPHRVKSISMATFTPEEIDIISTKGNEYCRRIWLGLYEPGRTNDARDEQGIKDFMIAKYEKKRYYIDPSMANMNGVATTSQASLSSSSSTSALNSSNIASAMSPVKPLSSLVGSITLPSLSTVSHPIPPAPNTFTPDDTSSGFLVDFGSLSATNANSASVNKVDPFGMPSASPSNNNSSNMNFADFDNNPIFGASNGMPSGNSLSTSQSFPGVGNRKSSSGGGSMFQQPPAEDRYAALKDLDSLMKSQQPDQNPTVSSAQPDWTQTSPAPSWAAFGTSPQPGGFSSSGFPTDTNSGSSTSNPFTNPVSSPWNVSEGAVANPFLSGQTKQSDQTMPFAWNGSGPGAGLNGASVNGFHVNSSAFPTSQSLTFPTKSWNTEQTGNPFVLGPSTDSGSHSNNPFL